MMIKSIVYTSVFCCLILAVSSIDGDSLAKIRCRADEVFTDCGSACPPKCSDLFFPRRIKFCTLQCVRGCFCKPGLYRTRDGRCVEPKECCSGANEFFNRCGSGCPPICGFEPRPCTAVCVPGCFCQDGYIRKDNSTNSPCISVKEC